MNPVDFRGDFPLTQDLIYLDNAATSLMPVQVADEIRNYDLHYRANTGRGIHRLSVMATHRFRDAHDTIRSFIGGDHGTLVLTKNTTGAIGTVASCISWKPGDRVVTTLLEHHSNLLPWLRLAGSGVETDLIAPDHDGSIDPEKIEAAINDDTKLVAVTHISNVTGTKVPVKEIGEICREKGIRLLVDGAQSAPHIPVNVEELGCDYFCFSGHKMLGPTGTGCLWMRRQDIEPLFAGGGSVKSVDLSGFIRADGWEGYEAGTQAIGGAIGLGRAVKYLKEIGMKRIKRHEEKLSERLAGELETIRGVSVVGGDTGKRTGIVSFNIDGMHPHDVAHTLDEAAAIMVRSGDHCCMPLMQHLDLSNGTVRAGTYLYNTRDEIDLLADTVREISRRLS